jgi:cell division transport system permease protein
VYMKPDATADQLAAVKREVEQLKTSGQVRSWTFVDKEAAFKEIKTLFRNDPESRDLFETPEQAPPSYRITPKVAETIDTLALRFEKREGVLQVRSNEAIKTLLRITKVIQYTLLGVALALLVAAVLLILNTIQLAIFSRRREVAVMKLVGATNWFIRLPFMMEGLLQGLFGALVAFAAVYVGTDRIQSAIRNSPAGLFKQFSVSSGQVLSTGMFMLVVGAVVGALGSALAVSRFLDV